MPSTHLLANQARAPRSIAWSIPVIVLQYKREGTAQAVPIELVQGSSGLMAPNKDEGSWREMMWSHDSRRGLA